ncbi:hypothetical protein SAMD00079811_67770 [Scytonema sp. HK-05]|uniref:hypothetical protein n=1 Tax=Scytonema sp. HK-05 TaxID=1137095 RepID=UPI000AFD7EE2|nr:hypothetical protein [Scytonema sp. HK-05]BAY49148.1 hypothetical protein SAMD00079811_67770 [Scytonema sp. HK-05]
MKDNIFAKMTDDTRALLQQMQAQVAPPPLDADPVQLLRDARASCSQPFGILCLT